MPRLFVAIDLPEPLKTSLAAICRGIPGARWVPPPQLHLTLKFIGEVDEAMFRRIKETLSASGLPALACRLHGLGRFPAKGQPRVLWVGLGDSRGDGLATWQRRVEHDLCAIGLPPEDRPFTPHITLARFKEPVREEVSAFLSRHADFHGDGFPVTAFHLYSSRLTPNGAIHTREHSYRCEKETEA